MNLLESILAKIVEVDRHILRKTEPETDPSLVTSGRRKSRGMDLYTLPTHLHLIDRLMDLHTQQKRVTVIKNIEPQTKEKEAAVGIVLGASVVSPRYLLSPILQVYVESFQPVILCLPFTTGGP